MRSSHRCILLAGLSVFLLVAIGSVHAQNKDKPKDKSKAEDVRFTSGDYVELRGYWYPSTKRKHGATVLLLHRMGGNCREDGWESLAEKLHSEGYAVLAFDFRGHGRSVKLADENKFWSLAQNNTGVSGFRLGSGRVPETISQSDFRPTYYPYLINDIYAAKIFIESRNDGAECNASRLILIGAEEGATLGLMWMDAELRRFRSPRLGELDAKPEGKDVICGIWLSLSRNLGRRNMGTSMTQWLRETGGSKDFKIPMAFVYGDKDSDADRFASSCLKLIKPNHVRSKNGDPMSKKDPMLATGEIGIKDSKLSGSKLLNKELDTENWIVNKYLAGAVFNKKGELNTSVEYYKDLSADWYERATNSSMYMYKVGLRLIPTKLGVAEKTMLPVPIPQLGLLR